MKFLLMMMLATLVINIHASELRSPKLREIVCKEVVRTSPTFVKENCLKGGIEILNTDSFKYNNVDYTISLNLKTSFLGSIFNVELNRQFDINSSKVEFRNWEATLISSTLSDYHLLVKTYEGDANTKIIENPSEIKNLPTTVLNWEGLMARSYSSKKDYDYYFVFNEKQKIIGYLVYIWYENEDADIKGYETQNFNSSGEQVGQGVGESWNYHE